MDQRGESIVNCAHLFVDRTLCLSFDNTPFYVTKFGFGKVQIKNLTDGKNLWKHTY
jgi:hypothetical protein